jgi:DNA-3-methyladenine glycosylase
MKLKENFYLKPTLSVAKDLIGCVLVHKDSDGLTSGKIVETEAYMGFDDKGSHSYGNRHTPKMDPLYKSGGHGYIFPIYGIGYCFNVVTEAENVPRAVLIRALEPIEGKHLMCKRRHFSCIKPSNLKNLTNGPVKLCEAMHIDGTINDIDLCGDELFILKGPKLKSDEKILTSTRINIGYAEEDQFKPWRFILEGNKFLSVTI